MIKKPLEFIHQPPKCTALFNDGTWTEVICHACQRRGIECRADGYNCHGTIVSAKDGMVDEFIRYDKTRAELEALLQSFSPACLESWKNKHYNKED